MTAGADPTVTSPETATTTEPTPESNALQAAQESGRPVEVVERTTETTQVMANPEGHFTLRSNARPVRVHQDGEWREVDLDLAPEGDGRIRPEASTVDVTFSGGGSGPAITVADGPNKVDFYWPAPLPAPTVSGSVATYPNVFPDVDLALSAGADGFSQVLVVKNAEAAANPAVRSISMSVATSGLTLAKEANDALTAKDATGTPVFVGSTPVMWDSTRDEHTSAPTVTESRGGQVSPVELTATPRSGTASTVTDVVITPDPAELTAADVVYPVFIDPGLTRNKWQWLQATTAGWTHYNTTHTAGVGYCGGWPDCGGYWRSRSFFTMDVGELNTRNGLEPRIFSAKFYATQTHGAHLCVAEPVDLYLTGDFNSTTVWPGAAGSWSWLDQKSSGAGDQCGGAGGLEFNAINAVTAGVNASPNWTNLSFVLRAPNEDERLQWKKFDNNPQLVIDYSYPPNAPVDFQVDNAVYCGGKIVVGTNRPTVSAWGSDNNNPPLNLNLWMDLVDLAGVQKSSMAGTGPTVIASGTRGYWTVPAIPTLADGDYRVRGLTENLYPGAANNNLSSPLVSADWTFKIRTAVPPQPWVSSVDYPRDYWGAPQNAPGTMTVTGTDAVGVAYSFDGAQPLQPGSSDCNYNRAPLNGSGWAVMHQGKATFRLPTNLAPGYHTMTVRTFSDAHKLSAPSDKYVFYVAPPLGAASDVKQAEGLSVTQPAGQNIPVSSQANCCNVTWGGGAQLRFGGTAVNQSFTLPVTATKTGHYDLGAVVTRSADYGQIKFTLVDNVTGSTSPVGPISYDAYSHNVMTDHVPLGKHYLDQNKTYSLTVTTVGTNPSTILTRYVVGIDEIVLTPTDRTEAEAAPRVGATDTLSVESNARWSMGSQLRFQGSQSEPAFGLKLTVKDGEEGDYTLTLGLTRALGYGRLTVKLDGEPLRGTAQTPIDASLRWGGAETRVDHEPLGGAHLTKGDHVLEFELRDRYIAGIDYLALTKITSTAVTTFESALNNNGVTAAGTSGELDIINNTLPAEALTTAGLGSGGIVAIGGATFTLPNWSTNTDNVIATGQTIAFDTTQQVKASAVGMLVTASCGDTPLAQAKITYAEPSGTGGGDRFTTPMVPVVGDWATGTDRDTAAVLPYRYTNGATDSTVHPRVYAVFIPVDPNLTLKHITLPRYGYMPGQNCQPSLHVFAIAPVKVQPSVWVGAWQAPADAAVHPPVVGSVSPDIGGFANRTLRTVIRPNVTGDSVRVRLANPFTTAPVTIGASTIGKRTTGSDVTAPTPLTFAGTASVTIPAGGEVTSDAVSFPAGATDLAISLHLPSAVSLAPHHPSTTATTLVSTGNQTTATTMPTPTTVSGTFFVTGVDVNTTPAPTDATGTVVVIGDQTSATAPSANGTWAERLTSKLQPTQGLSNASRVGNVLGHWKLDGTHNDHAGTTNLTAAAGPAAFNSDSERGSVATFNRATVLSTSGPVVNTQGSYSVATWVKLAATDGYFTAVSQCGNQVCAFYLQYNKDRGKWVFLSPSSDTSSPASFPAAVGTTPTLNKWTHLVGTYDAATNKMSLYIDGTLAGSATNTTPFTAGGPLAVGGGKRVDGTIVPSNHFHGSISNVWAVNRTITAEEAHQLAKDSTQLGAPTASDALDELNRTTYNTPRLHSVILAVGANDLLDASGTDHIKIKDTIRDRLIKLALTDPSSLTNRNAPNGALVRMHLTTIPPLGLAATDPREKARQALNDDIRLNYSDYHAERVFDIAAAIQDPNSPHLIQGTYLTNNKPNDAYHNTIAGLFPAGTL